MIDLNYIRGLEKALEFCDAIRDELSAEEKALWDKHDMLSHADDSVGVAANLSKINSVLKAMVACVDIKNKIDAEIYAATNYDPQAEAV